MKASRPWKIKASAAIFLLSAGAAAALAQTGWGLGRLQGTVLDQDQKPIAGANVVVERVCADPDDNRFIKMLAPGHKLPEGFRFTATVRFEMATDAGGEWVFPNLGKGIWLVSASKDGFHPGRRLSTVRQLYKNRPVPLTLEKLWDPQTKDAPSGPALDIANTLYYLRKYDEALSYYRKAREADPKDFMIHLAIAFCYQDKGDLERAASEFQEIAEETAADPLDRYFTARACAGAAECRFAQRDVARAAELYERALAIWDGEPEWAYNLGEISFAQGKTAQAAAYYRKAVEGGSGWAEPYYKLGMALLNLGDKPGAKAAFERFIFLDPRSNRSAWIKDVLSKLAP